MSGHGSTHAYATRAAINEEMRSDPNAGVTYADYLIKMMNGHFSQRYVERIVQKSYGSLDIYDAANFSVIHALIWMGKIVLAGIDLRDTPSADAEIAANDHVLRTLPEPFSGRFYGGKGDDDGYVSWDKPIIGTKYGSSPDGGDRLERYEIPSGQAPLEVGTTAASRSWLHLASEKMLARWPYRSKELTIFVVIDRDAIGIGARPAKPPTRKTRR